MRRVVTTGLRAWLLQRLSAVAMLLFLVYVLLHFLVAAPHSYLQWNAWVRTPAVAIAASVFFGALLLHAWVGLRDVVMDYVKPLAGRIAVLAAIALVLLAFALWVLRILFIIPG